MPLIRKTGGNAPTPPPSVEGLTSASADARWAAARALTSRDDMGALAAALERETDARVREAIFTSLANIGGAESVRVVMRQIRSDDAAVRTGALDALKGMHGEVMAGLPGLLADPDADVRLLACELVRSLPGPEPVALLCDLVLRETEANVAAAGIEVLAEVGGPDALPALDACAARFADQPFLVFSIRIARERIGAQS